MNSVNLQDTKLIYRYLLHSYILITVTERKIPIYDVPQRIKYLGINFTREVKSLSAKNYWTLMKEIEGDINKWKDIPS